MRLWSWVSVARGDSALRAVMPTTLRIRHSATPSLWLLPSCLLILWPGPQEEGNLCDLEWS